MANNSLVTVSTLAKNNEKIKEQLNEKVNIQQNVTDSGKLLGIGVDGKVVPVEAPSSVDISSEQGNAIIEKNDGLYVPSVSETKVSESENNVIEIKQDGIYVAPADLTNYVEKVDGKGLSTNDLTDEMVEKIRNTYTKTEVDDAITNAQLGGEEVDLTGYVKTETLTETLADYAKTEDIPEAYDDTVLSDRVTANEEAIATLNGTGEGSVYKTVDDALNKFATDISDDGVVNTYKELVDYAASHSSDIAEMVTDIADNATAIEELNTKVTDLETSVEGVYTKDETYSRTEIDEKITESQTGMDVYSTDDWDSFYSALSIDATTI